MTLFNKVLRAAFKTHLADFIPNRVLPVSAHPPRDLMLLLERELQEVDELLAAKKRRGARAAAKLRSLLAFTAAMKDERITEVDLEEAIVRRRKGQDWSLILPEIAQLKLSSDGTGIPISMRIHKQGEIPVRMALPGEQPVGVVVKQEVNPFDKFNLGLDDLAKKLSLTRSRTLALVYEYDVQDDTESFRVMSVGAVQAKRYSKKALDRLRKEIDDGVDLAAVWQKHRHRMGSAKKKA